MSFLRRWIVGEPETVAEVVAEERQKGTEIAPKLIVEKSISICPLKPVPPPPISIPLRPDNMVKPFCVRSIDHQVMLDGIIYQIHASNFDWLYGGNTTYADITISRDGFWSVKKTTVDLTYKGRVRDKAEAFIGPFANVGLAVKRELIDACLYPIQNQVLEIERHLKGY